MNQALLIVDLQNDFLEDGALAVQHSNSIIPIINSLIDAFDHVVCTRDMHPKNHVSFASRFDKNILDVIDFQGTTQVLWPDHCVVGQWGSEYPSELKLSANTKEFFKGTHPDVDSYSIFFDSRRQPASKIDQYLQKHAVKELYIVGLATDYCVKETVLDALDLGYEVHFVLDACRAVNASPDDEEKAIHEMQKKGALEIQSQQLLSKAY